MTRRGNSRQMVRKLGYETGRGIELALTSDSIKNMIEIASCAIREN
jgi:hypothetical protein